MSQSRIAKLKLKIEDHAQKRKKAKDLGELKSWAERIKAASDAAAVANLGCEHLGALFDPQTVADARSRMIEAKKLANSLLKHLPSRDLLGDEKSNRLAGDLHNSSTGSEKECKRVFKDRMTERVQSYTNIISGMKRAGIDVGQAQQTLQILETHLTKRSYALPKNDAEWDHVEKMLADSQDSIAAVLKEKEQQQFMINLASGKLLTLDTIRSPAIESLLNEHPQLWKVLAVRLR